MKIKEENSILKKENYAQTEENMINVLLVYKNDEKRILLDGKKEVRVNDIMYIEVDKPYIVLCCTNGNNECLRGSLIQFENKIGLPFARAGRKYLVNLEHVRKVTEYVVLDNDMRIKLSKAGKVELKSVFEDYLLKECERQSI